MTVGEEVAIAVVLPGGYDLTRVGCAVTAWSPDPCASNNRVRLRLARRTLVPRLTGPAGHGEV